MTRKSDLSFDGDLVSLGIYLGTLQPSGLLGFGEVMVTPGIVTFPEFAALNVRPGPDEIVPGSADLQGSDITFSYPACVEGTTFATSSINAYVFTVLTPNAPPITGVSLIPSNIVGVSECRPFFHRRLG